MADLKLQPMIRRDGRWRPDTDYERTLTYRRAHAIGRPESGVLDVGLRTHGSPPEAAERYLASVSNPAIWLSPHRVGGGLRWRLTKASEQWHNRVRMAIPKADGSAEEQEIQPQVIVPLQPNSTAGLALDILYGTPQHFRIVATWKWLLTIPDAAVSRTPAPNGGAGRQPDLVLALSERRMAVVVETWRPHLEGRAGTFISAPDVAELLSARSLPMRAGDVRQHLSQVRQTIRTYLGGASRDLRRSGLIATMLELDMIRADGGGIQAWTQTADGQASYVDVTSGFDDGRGGR